MGWLFGKKKPKVPFPEGKKVQEGALQFPSQAPERRVIEPDAVKEAVGIGRPLPPSPPLAPVQEEMVPVNPSPKATTKRMVELSSFQQQEEPLFIKMDVYRKILSELDHLKVNFAELREFNKNLEEGEYNEEYKFTKLRRSVKGMHDKLLEMDKILFKS